MSDNGFTTITGKVLKYGAVALVTSPLWVPALFVGYVGFLTSKAAFKHPWKTVAALTLAGTLAYGVRSGKLEQGWHELRDAHQDKARISQLEEQLDQKTSTYDALSQQHLREAQETSMRISALEKVLEERVRSYASSPGTPRAPLTPPTTTIPTLPPVRSVVERVPATMPPRAAHPGMIEEPGVNYYYVKQDDTLSGIAAYVGASSHIAIARRNGIFDPRQLMTGQLLRIPKEECRIYRPDIYIRVPDLASTILPGDVRISERFTDPGKVFALNQQLGLVYSDTYKYPDGKRVVWYPK